MLAKRSLSGAVSSSQQCAPSEPPEIQQIIEARWATATQILASTPYWRFTEKLHRRPRTSR